MKKLISLPSNIVNSFYELTGLDREEYFCCSDPVGKQLGSGCGTVWILDKSGVPSSDKKIVLHASGQSKRLPCYATSGKALIPIPVFRWGRGQRISQNLMSLQLPLYERILKAAPSSLTTLIASGDVLIHCDNTLPPIPNADVVCYGMWVEPELATNHGVFVMQRERMGKLECMLQKPSIEELGNLTKSHFYMMDIGVWILSEKAVDVLKKRSMTDGEYHFYDLYSEFGLGLGSKPSTYDEDISSLSVAVVPLDNGQFYHYGTTREMISSTLAIQNLESDQRKILHIQHSPHPSVFVQNCSFHNPLTEENRNIWIENSCVGSKWHLTSNHTITGVPENDWEISLPSGTCIDMVPIADELFAIRVFGYYDTFKDQCAELSCYPLCRYDECFDILSQMIDSKQKIISTNLGFMTASELLVNANLKRLFAQRDEFLKKNIPAIASNYRKSIFYQLDLSDLADHYHRLSLPLPETLPEDTPVMTAIRDNMFRSKVTFSEESESYRERAFSLLRNGLLGVHANERFTPRLDVYPDQIVWARSPVRIDLAGGWTDTPPYCLNEGGNVVNIAIELNGQTPIQVFVKPSQEYSITMRSIDLGAAEVIRTYEDLSKFNQVGSPFSIPKAALALAGFVPEYCTEHHNSLRQQLESFGSGIEISLLAAIPAGSGLGTSSILAATSLGALSDFCGLGWDKSTICNRTLLLEQLLTTGGGWQDQYGGVLQGVKLLQTADGFSQTPITRWLPEMLFTQPGYKECHLLYYTGITRTAKHILSDIVSNMFLNSKETLTLLSEMKHHAITLSEAIQKGNIQEMGHLIGQTWVQNKQLDSGINPPEIESIISKISDYCLGYKLPGAGGGGYLYMIAKDLEAASRIKKNLTQAPINNKARFVELSLSETGLSVSRS